MQAATGLESRCFYQRGATPGECCRQEEKKDGIYAERRSKNLNPSGSCQSDRNSLPRKKGLETYCSSPLTLFSYTPGGIDEYVPYLNRKRHPFPAGSYLVLHKLISTHEV